jgi:hypothetical protein
MTGLLLILDALKARLLSGFLLAVSHDYFFFFAAFFLRTFVPEVCQLHE